MPWKDSTVIDERVKFVRAYDKYVRSRERTMADLCAEHGIARKTGYKMLERRDQGGWPALAERSRAPHSGPHWCSSDVVAQVLEIRLEFSHWGAETILSHLQRTDPDTSWPSASTIHGWLKQAGLVERSSSRRRYPHPGKPALPALERPNQQWSVDFKGHFRTRDRRYCYPLTVADSFSRYLIGCQGLTSTAFELVWPVFERLFREYGLPESILSDNGTPFSSNSVKRLSKLSVRWIRLGIVPRLTQPGKPQQNGQHERMHGHMKRLVCSEPSANCREQQKQFDWFEDHYNRVRPHASLDKKVPADLYTPSLRAWPTSLPALDYPSHFLPRRVRSNGEIKWQGQSFFLSEPLVGEMIAFELVADGCWILHFGPVELGFYSARDRKLHLDRPRPAGKAENA
jgi:transposase InsO family protein